MDRNHPTPSDSTEEPAASENVYGWGVFNTRLNQFVGVLGGGPRGNDADIVERESAAINHYKQLTEGEDKDYLRVVRVQLDAAADREACWEV